MITSSEASADCPTDFLFTLTDQSNKPYSGSVFGLTQDSLSYILTVQTDDASQVGEQVVRVHVRYADGAGSEFQDAGFTDVKAIVELSCPNGEASKGDEPNELCEQEFLQPENSAPKFKEEISPKYTFERGSLDSTEVWNLQLGDIVDQEEDDYEISFEPGPNTFITYDQ